MDPRLKCPLFHDYNRREVNCVEKTVRNKINKMTYLHVYFDNYGVTKFTKSQRYGWQVSLGMRPNWNIL